MSESKAPKIKIDKEFKTVLDTLENSRDNILLTGRAGTGKSTLLSHFRNITKKNIAVIAPTGVAALNVGGQTIHSFFKFNIGITPSSVEKVKDARLYKKLDAIIIDEISMVRADLLDCIDKFLRKNKSEKRPFGGVQMIFIGDLFQLPPVVTEADKEIFSGNPYNGPYFFNAKVIEQMGAGDTDNKSATNFLNLELTKIRRQHPHDEEDFITFLNAIRERKHTEEDLEIINQRFEPEYDEFANDMHILIVPTNAMADQHNQVRLANIDGNEFTFMADMHGSWNDESGRDKFPTSELLELKIGAQVMLLNNDSSGKWVNGDIGEIINISSANTEIIVKLNNGKDVTVGQYKWEKLKYKYDAMMDTITTEVIATFTQFPIKLAWASTVHKVQGKTFDKVVINFGRGTFAHGQAYVALSRCRTLKGTILKQPIRNYDIKVDERVIRFVESLKG